MIHFVRVILYQGKWYILQMLHKWTNEYFVLNCSINNGEVGSANPWNKLFKKILSKEFVCIKYKHITLYTQQHFLVYIYCIVTFVHINANDWNSTVCSFSENTAWKTHLDYFKLDFDCIFITLTEKTNPYEPFQSNYIHIETYWISLHSPILSTPVFL